MSSNVEKIKERLGIEEVVSSYVKLERAGKNLKGKCPFHNEKTPSFYVSPENQAPCLLVGTVTIF
jgi:DNA primase